MSAICLGRIWRPLGSLSHKITGRQQRHEDNKRPQEQTELHTIGPESIEIVIHF